MAGIQPVQVPLKSMPPPDPDLLTIGELAERTGLATSALRYYEELGLLHPTTRLSGRRRYDPSSVDAVGGILFLRDVGFTLQEIKALGAARSRSPKAWQELARRKLDELDVEAQCLAELRAVEGEVGEVVDHAAELPAGVTRHERVHRSSRLHGERLARERVDALDHRDVVGHELVEAHVDRLIGRQRVAVVDARPQHALRPVGPV